MQRVMVMSLFVFLVERNDGIYLCQLHRDIVKWESDVFTIWLPIYKEQNDILLLWCQFAHIFLQVSDADRKTQFHRWMQYLFSSDETNLALQQRKGIWWIELKCTASTNAFDIAGTICNVFWNNSRRSRVISGTCTRCHFTAGFIRQYRIC